MAAARQFSSRPKAGCRRCRAAKRTQTCRPDDTLHFDVVVIAGAGCEPVPIETPGPRMRERGRTEMRDAHPDGAKLPRIAAP